MMHDEKATDFIRDIEQKTKEGNLLPGVGSEAPISVTQENREEAYRILETVDAMLHEGPFQSEEERDKWLGELARIPELTDDPEALSDARNFRDDILKR